LGRERGIVALTSYSTATTGSEIDLVVALLDSALVGYNFIPASLPPRVGQPVFGISYPLAGRLTLSQGHVEKAFKVGSIPYLMLGLPEAVGSSGGPILDARGYVIGLTQVGTNFDAVH
jgi:trypsin-like peptidase